MTDKRLNTMTDKRLCRCGRKKDDKSARCRFCRKQDDFDAMQARPISYYICKHPLAKAKYNDIRTWARRTMERYGPTKWCHVCGFDVVVEVCHLKPIVDFPETALMSEVNSLSNLIYLCPNHHAMLDKGLLDITLS